MRRILVLRGGALGDFIVTLPALAALRERWPQAQIELVGNVTAAELARSRGLLDAVHSQHEARWSALYGEAELPGEFARWLGDFDLVLNYWPDPEGELARRFPARDGQTFLSTSALPTIAPAAAHYCEPLRKLSIEPRAHIFPLATQSRSGLRPDSLIAIHPGSGSAKKNWPLENWRALLETLPAPCSVILGEAEQPRWKSFASHHLLIQRPLEELVAHLAQCRLFLGHDSGISHLAAACGVPCILLFGPTDPVVWAPPAPHVRVIKRGAVLGAISVPEVQRSISEFLTTDCTDITDTTPR